jgi:hypothetical protein
VESFPLSAWRSLRLPSLPAKSKSQQSDIQKHLNSLIRTGIIMSGAQPTHDQLQALVAGVAGLELLTGSTDGYHIAGIAPFILEGFWREGYIVNPLPKSQLSLPAT